MAAGSTSDLAAGGEDVCAEPAEAIASAAATASAECLQSFLSMESSSSPKTAAYRRRVRLGACTKGQPERSLVDRGRSTVGTPSCILFRERMRFEVFMKRTGTNLAAGRTHFAERD